MQQKMDIEVLDMPFWIKADPSVVKVDSAVDTMQRQGYADGIVEVVV